MWRHLGGCYNFGNSLLTEGIQVIQYTGVCTLVLFHFLSLLLSVAAPTFDVYIYMYIHVYIRIPTAYLTASLSYRHLYTKEAFLYCGCLVCLSVCLSVCLIDKKK